MLSFVVKVHQPVNYEKVICLFIRGSSAKLIGL